MLTFTNKIRSFTKNRWDMPTFPWEALRGVQVPLVHFLIRCPRSSMQRMSMYGDRGSPFLIPLEGVKGSKAPLINHNWDTCGWDTTHDDLDEVMGKVKGLKHLVDEAPLQFFICLLKVHLDCHKPTLSFFLSRLWIRS